MLGKAERAWAPSRRAIMIVAGILAVTLPAAATDRSGTDPGALRDYVEAYQKVWNTRDAAAVAAFFAEDADVVMGNVPAVRGRAAIETWWRAYFERQEPERRGTFDVTAARLLTPDVGLVNIDSTTHGVSSGGDPLPVRRFRGTWLLRRDGTEWRIEAMRGQPTEEDRVELKPSLETAESLRPQVRALVAAYEDAFNRRDPDALSALYREDADLIVRNGPVVRGEQAIRDWWHAYFEKPRSYRALFIVDEIRMLGDDAALLNVTATGAPLEPSSEPVPVRSARGTWVLVRQGGRWRIAALRVLQSESDRLIRASDR